MGTVLIKGNRERRQVKVSSYLQKVRMSRLWQMWFVHAHIIPGFKHLQPEKCLAESLC